MNRDRYERLKAVFHAAVEAPPHQRGEYIRAECAGDADLESEVLLLLGQLDGADEFLESPPSTPAPGAPATPSSAIASAPDALRFASYTVIRTLGRGGMGVVYLAQQDGTKRTVALKVIRAGVATPGTLRRFAFEAQVLGRLNHPGIAQVYEAGTADTGQGPQPYFAMELVDGVPITQHAKDHALSVPDRLALLAQVCDAVEYAHVKGVIHRDLKPGNVLVDRAGLVKVLDFGVARATTPASDSGTTGIPSLDTEQGQMVGTLPYMSPEQIAGDPDDLDTRSDVHALGVIGYELLAGKPAFDVDRLPPLEAARLVQQTDPAPLGSIDALCRGDIETVIAKAMEKDRDRRYQSAAAMGADVRRYLTDQPIEARPASAWYQARKFARRNRSLASAMIAGLLTTVAGLGVALHFSVAEHQARNAAELAGRSAEEQRTLAQERLSLIEAAQAKQADEAATAQATGDFFRQLLLSSSPELSRGRDMTVREILDIASSGYLSDLSENPRAQAAVESTIGEAYRRLGDSARALELFDHALPVQRTVLGDDHRDTLNTRHNRAIALRELARFDEAIQEAEGVLERRRVVLGTNHPSSLATAVVLAALLEKRLRFEDSERLYREIILAGPRDPGPGRDHVVSASINLGRMLRARGRLDEAAPLIRSSFDDARREFGEDHPRTLVAGALVASLLEDENRLDEAEAVIRNNLTIRERVYVSNPKETLPARAKLGAILLAQKKYDEAEPVLREVANQRERLQGVTHPDTAVALANLSAVLGRLNRLAEAEESARRALTIQRTALGPLAPNTLMSQSQLAELMRQQGNVADAITLLRQTIEDARASKTDPVTTATFHGMLGRCLRDAGQYEEAEREMLRCDEVLRGLKPSDPRRQKSETDLEELHRIRLDPDKQVDSSSR